MWSNWQASKVHVAATVLYAKVISSLKAKQLGKHSLLVRSPIISYGYQLV